MAHLFENRPDWNLADPEARGWMSNKEFEFAAVIERGDYIGIMANNVQAKTRECLERQLEAFKAEYWDLFIYRFSRAEGVERFLGCEHRIRKYK